jgi:hypothetical protein
MSFQIGSINPTDPDPTALPSAAPSVYRGGFSQNSESPAGSDGTKEGGSLLSHYSGENAQSDPIRDDISAMKEAVRMIAQEYDNKEMQPVIKSDKGKLFDTSGNVKGYFDIEWQWRKRGGLALSMVLWPTLDHWISIPPPEDDKTRRMSADLLIKQLGTVIDREAISDTLVEHVKSIISWVRRSRSSNSDAVRTDVASDRVI